MCKRKKKKLLRKLLRIDTNVKTITHIFLNFNKGINSHLKRYKLTPPHKLPYHLTYNSNIH